MTTSESPRILLCCLRDIGQAVAAMPTLSALRQHYPHSWLGWVCEPKLQSWLENHGALDHLIVAPSDWSRSLREVRRLRKRLRSQQFCTSLDLQSETTSALAGWLSDARTRIGFRTPRPNRLSQLLNNCHVSNHALPPAARNLQLLRPLGIEQPQLDFQLPSDPAAERYVDNWILRTHLRCGFMLVHAAGPSGSWRARDFGRVARNLGERFQIPSVVARLGGCPHDDATTVVAHSGGHAVPSPLVNWMQMVALVRRAKSLLTLDPDCWMLAAATRTTLVESTTDLASGEAPAWAKHSVPAPIDLLEMHGGPSAAVRT